MKKELKDMLVSAIDEFLTTYGRLMQDTQKCQQGEMATRYEKKFVQWQNIKDIVEKEL